MLIPTTHSFHTHTNNTVFPCSYQQHILSILIPTTHSFHTHTNNTVFRCSYQQQININYLVEVLIKVYGEDRVHPASHYAAIPLLTVKFAAPSSTNEASDTADIVEDAPHYGGHQRMIGSRPDGVIFEKLVELFPQLK